MVVDDDEEGELIESDSRYLQHFDRGVRKKKFNNSDTLSNSYFNARNFRPASLNSTTFNDDKKSKKNFLVNLMKKKSISQQSGSETQQIQMTI